MVRFINEIILKYLLGISKCTKLPGKKQTKKKIKQNKTKKYLRTNTSLHIGHIYRLEIILATFSLKHFLFFFFVIIIIIIPFFLEKKNKQNETKPFPSSVLNSTDVVVVVFFFFGLVQH